MTNTTVRNLTAGERAQLVPLLRQLHDHARDCAACAEMPVPETAAELGAANYCSVGADLYRRWLHWLATGG